MEERLSALGFIPPSAQNGSWGVRVTNHDELGGPDYYFGEKHWYNIEHHN